MLGTMLWVEKKKDNERQTPYNCLGRSNLAVSINILDWTKAKNHKISKF